MNNMDREERRALLEQRRSAVAHQLRRLAIELTDLDRQLDDIEQSKRHERLQRVRGDVVSRWTTTSLARPICLASRRCRASASARTASRTGSGHEQQDMGRAFRGLVRYHHQRRGVPVLMAVILAAVWGVMYCWVHHITVADISQTIRRFVDDGQGDEVGFVGAMRAAGYDESANEELEAAHKICGRLRSDGSTPTNVVNWMKSTKPAGIDAAILRKMTLDLVADAQCACCRTRCTTRDGRHADTDDDRTPGTDSTADDGGDDRAALPDPGMDMATVGHERILPRPPKRLGGMRRVLVHRRRVRPRLTRLPIHARTRARRRTVAPRQHERRHRERHTPGRNGDEGAVRDRAHRGVPVGDGRRRLAQAWL